MTGKEKLKNAINHQDAPLLLDIGGGPTTGMHCSLVEKMRDYYGLEKRTVKIVEPMQMLGEMDEDLKEAMGIQTIGIDSGSNLFGFRQDNYKEFCTPWGQEVLVPGAFEVDVDAKGDLFLYAQGNRNYPPAAHMPVSGFFFDMTNRAEEFDEDDYNVEDNFAEFGPIDDTALAHLQNMRDQYENTSHAVMGNLGSTSFGDIALVPGPSLVNPKGIRRMDDWYMATVIHQDKIHEIFEYELDWAIKNLEKMSKVLGDTIQIAYICGNDFGTQRAPFCSPETFRSLYAPYYKAVNDWIHTHTNWKTFKHTCGNIRVLIPELIDAGFDCLNPVQWTADNMDRREIKKEFGDHVVYWGGGVDTQRTLPFGTPDEVYHQVLENCKIFGKGGGFVFNTIHNIVANTPVENLAAMVRAVKEYNGEN